VTAQRDMDSVLRNICLGSSVLFIALVCGSSASASVDPPSLSVTPKGDFHDGQVISVSVGANGFFTPNSHVNILECADAGGTTANLPTDDSTCDGNTIQGNTVLISADGSFDTSYTIYSLPNSTLAEQPRDQPVCNQTSKCVLFVGQDQNDFSKPKVFSAPFDVDPTSASTTSSTSTSTTVAGGKSGQPDGSGATTSTSLNGGSPTSTTSTTMPSSGAAPSAAVSISPASTSSADASDPSTLPNTGASTDLAWIAGAGVVLLVVGSLGRRRLAVTRS
jgi:LPXTG-motif cell wall-anchored protein